MIGSHPSLPQGPSSTDWTEPGLDPNEAHYFMPLGPININIPIGSSSYIYIPGFVPKNPNGSQVRETLVTAVSGGKENVEGEEEREGGEDDEGRWSGEALGRRWKAGVEEFGRWWHNCELDLICRYWSLYWISLFMGFSGLKTKTAFTYKSVMPNPEGIVYL